MNKKLIFSNNSHKLMLFKVIKKQHKIRKSIKTQLILIKTSFMRVLVQVDNFKI